MNSYEGGKINSHTRTRLVISCLGQSTIADVKVVKAPGNASVVRFRQVLELGLLALNNNNATRNVSSPAKYQTIVIAVNKPRPDKGGSTTRQRTTDDEGATAKQAASSTETTTKQRTSSAVTTTAKPRATQAEPTTTSEVHHNRVTKPPVKAV